MSLLDTLDRLRAKPLHVRRRIAFLTTSAFSLVIISVWWGSWSTNLETAGSGHSATTEKSPTEAVFQMFSNLKEGTVEGWNEAMGQIQYAAEHPEVMAAVGGSASGTPESIPFDELLQMSQ